MKFNVTVTALVTVTYIIEADNGNEAFDRATDLFFEDRIESMVVQNREQDISGGEE